ncbi:Cytochrome [Abeliophyllum distichum]|uniref:Cytochrome n=1 Tax=Abeliophyllum distichum TaxID=126358 RepID=A0ABD1U2M6_9LAMI
MSILFATQGIEGPAKKFIHGNTKEIMSIKQQSMKYPMEITHDIFPRVQPHFYSWMKLYGMNFLTWAGLQPHMVITELELAKEILNDKEGMNPKIKIRGIVKKLLGDGLVVAEGEKWSKVRKLANHAFYAENLKDMVPAMIASVEIMLEKWRDYEGKEIDVCKEFMVLGSEVISRTAFGSSYLEGKNIFEMLTRLGFIVAKSSKKYRFPCIEKIFRTEYDIESDRIVQSLRDSIMAIVKNREEKVMTGEADNFGSDFLGSLLKVHHDSDKKNRISVDDVIDECKVFYIAGHETTSSLLSWTSLLLAIHPDWQEKARKEVLELYGKENPTSEGLARMKIVTMIINESLRLYSPAASLVRRVKSRVRLGKYEFPRNMELHIPQLALHRYPEIWGEDAHLFKPDRFAEGVAKATKNNPMAFLPFGSGPRTCIGLNFATNEVKIALSMVLQRYKFTSSPNYVHPPLLIITLRPLHGVQIMLEPVVV